MKLKKLVVCLLLCIVLVGCAQKESRNNEYTDTYRLLYFYIDTCPRCKDFQEQILPMIEDEFGEHLEIITYDLDDFSTKEPYDAIVNQLIGFDLEEDYGYAPFIVLDGYFAKLGIFSNDGEAFVDDLIRAVNGKPLGNALSENRFLFRDGKITQ
jgi:hypothetical protein